MGRVWGETAGLAVTRRSFQRLTRDLAFEGIGRAEGPKDAPLTVQIDVHENPGCLTVFAEIHGAEVGSPFQGSGR